MGRRYSDTARMQEDGPQAGGAANEDRRRRPSLAVAVPVVVVVAVVSWISYLALGIGLCGGDGGTPYLDPHDPANAYCKFQDPAWGVGTVYGPLSFYERFYGNPGPGKPLLNGPSTLQRIRESLPLVVPIALAALGVILGLVRRDRRFFYWLATASVAAIVAPWVTVIVLRATG